MLNSSSVLASSFPPSSHTAPALNVTSRYRCHRSDSRHFSFTSQLLPPMRVSQTFSKESRLCVCSTSLDDTSRYQVDQFLFTYFKPAASLVLWSTSMVVTGTEYSYPVTWPLSVQCYLLNNTNTVLLLLVWVFYHITYIKSTISSFFVLWYI